MKRALYIIYKRVQRYDDILNTLNVILINYIKYTFRFILLSFKPSTENNNKKNEKD